MLSFRSHSSSLLHCCCVFATHTIAMGVRHGSGWAFAERVPPTTRPSFAQIFFFLLVMAWCYSDLFLFVDLKFRKKKSILFATDYQKSLLALSFTEEKQIFIWPPPFFFIWHLHQASLGVIFFYKKKNLAQTRTEFGGDIVLKT